MTNRINGLQMFCLIVLFELGSALLMGYGKDAGRGAWIVLLLGIVMGLLLYCIYTALFYQYPTLPLTSYSQKILGKYVGWTIGFLYVLYFMYIAARFLYNFIDLLITAAYENTSPFIIGFFMMLSVIYVFNQGLEVIGRLAGICFVLVIVTLVVIVVFELASKLVLFENLRPVLEYGWKPILSQLFPLVTTVPFGEMVTFSMILPFLDHSHQARKIGMFAVALSGLYLSFSLALHISILGDNLLIRSTFPFLSTVSLINIADFITRMEPLVVILLVILGFFKIIVFFFCAIIGAADLLNIKQMNRLSYPIGFLILAMSFAINANYIEFLKVGTKIVPYYLHLPFQIIIPLILLLIVMIRKIFLFIAMMRKKIETT